jgi:hypothetical protein
MNELNDIPKNNPFKVPEKYFEEVNRKILSGTAGFDSGIQKIGIIRKLRPYLAVAASVALLVVLSYTAIHFFARSENRSEFPGITLSEYTDNYINDIDIISLEENAAETGLFREETGFNKNDIMDYLVLDNIDIYDIYEHF